MDTFLKLAMKTIKQDLNHIISKIKSYQQQLSQITLKKTSPRPTKPPITHLIQISPQTDEDDHYPRVF